MDRKKANLLFNIFSTLLWVTILIVVIFRIFYVYTDGQWSYTIICSLCVCYIVGVGSLLLYLLTRKWGREYIIEAYKEWFRKEEQKKLAKRAKFWDTWYNGPSFMDHFKDDDPWRY